MTQIRLHQAAERCEEGGGEAGRGVFGWVRADQVEEDSGVSSGGSRGNGWSGRKAAAATCSLTCLPKLSQVRRQMAFGLPTYTG